MNLNRSDRKKLAVNLLFELLGSAIYSVGIHCFTAPNHIAPGGVTGLATLANYLWGLPIGLVTMAINLPLLLLAWKFLGRHSLIPPE